ncbi:P-loop containing nucleoside triphosphate hydrolase protein [Hyaloraphidium curvatum]|nr:P-loop containing nucleoside triphosphate hydrolase protein [Hyaloraphidium curvatum]
MPIAQVRFSPSIKSGFANLPPAWVNALWDTRKDLRSNDVVLELSWSTPSADGKEAKRNTAYVGWAGGSSGAGTLPPILKSEASGGPTNVTHQLIELDSFFGKGLGLQDGQKVSVEFVKNAVRGSRVHVEPATEDDWEILELQAGYLEEQLLSQVRVVSAGQLMSVWGRGQTPITLRVVETDPVARCVRLDNDVEVIVAPKQRASSSSAPKEVFGAGVSDSANGSAADGVALELRSFPREYLRDLDARPLDGPSVVISCHPANLQQLCGSWEPSTVFYLSPAVAPERDALDELDATERQKSAAEGSTGERRKEDEGAKPPRLPGLHVRVRPSADVPRDHVGVSREARVQLGIGSFDRLRLSFPVGQPLKVSKLVARRISKGSSRSIVLSGKGAKLAEEQAKRFVGSARDAFASASLGTVLNDGQRISLPDPARDGRLSSYVFLLEGKLPQAAKANVQDDVALYTVVDGASATRIPLDLGADMHMAEEEQNPPDVDVEPILGGVETLRQQLRDYIRIRLGCRELRSQLKAPGIGGVLLYGAHGSGKTALLEALFYEMSRSRQVLANCRLVECGAFADEPVSNLKETLREILQEASFRAPSIVAFDNLDRLLMAEQEHMDSSRYRQASELFCDMAREAMEKYELVVIATAQSQASLNATLAENRVFDEVVHLLPPSKKQRREILEAVLSSGTKVLSQSLPHLDLVDICSSTEGYLASDLRTLVERALQAATMRQLLQLSNSTVEELEAGQLMLQQEDFRAAQEGYVPSSLRGVKLQTSDVSWSDIGGLTETRRALKETFEWPTKYAAIFANCPLRLRSGLLLYGFPGCGKTMLASAVAKECGLNFISVKGPEILNKYIGASEAGVRDLFERAQAAKPCVLFFDEFDAIAPRRGHDNTGVTDRVVNQLLTQMDGAEKVEGVYVLAATSRPDLIDPALLRPGRLDKSLLCGMPDEGERAEVGENSSPADRALHLSFRSCRPLLRSSPSPRTSISALGPQKRPTIPGPICKLSCTMPICWPSTKESTHPWRKRRKLPRPRRSSWRIGCAISRSCLESCSQLVRLSFTPLAGTSIRDLRAAMWRAQHEKRSAISPGWRPSLTCLRKHH